MRRKTKTLAQQLKVLMARRDYDTSDLFSKAELKPYYIREVVRGNVPVPPLADVEELARALGYPVSALIPGTDIDEMESRDRAAYVDWQMMQPKERG